jgi:ABC-type polysaccharide/polyol phosphate transport system ATPase subunit
MPILEEWCNRAILLDHGRIVAMGDVKEIAAVYQQAA